MISREERARLREHIRNFGSVDRDEATVLLDALAEMSRKHDVLRDSLDAIRTTLADHGATLTRAEKAEAELRASRTHGGCHEDLMAEVARAAEATTRAEKAEASAAAMREAAGRVMVTCPACGGRGGVSTITSIHDRACARCATAGYVAMETLTDAGEKLLARHAEEVAGLKAEVEDQKTKRLAAAVAFRRGEPADSPRPPMERVERLILENNTLRAKVQRLTAALRAMGPAGDGDLDWLRQYRRADLVDALAAALTDTAPEVKS